MRVGITGASGLIGSALVAALRERGDTAVPFVRRDAAAREIAWNPAERRLDPADLAGLDAVVNLAGAGIGDHRWTDEYRRELIESRTAGTALLAETLASLDDGPRTLVNASAIGYYGDRGDEVLTEASAPGDGFLAEICTAWEAAAEPAAAGGRRVAKLRTGIVLSADGGALPKLLPLFKLGVGGRFGDGRQWMSWISIDDEIAAILHVLDHPLAGPVNLVAPNPVTNRELASTIGTVLRRPSRVPVPAFGPRLLLGGDRADALLFDGQRVLPEVLRADGFEFRHATLDVALRAVLGR